MFHHQQTPHIIDPYDVPETLFTGVAGISEIHGWVQYMLYRDRLSPGMAPAERIIVARLICPREVALRSNAAARCMLERPAAPICAR